MTLRFRFVHPKVLARCGFVLVLASPLGCQDARPTGITPRVSLAQRTHQPAATTPLAPVTLATQADFDALELRVLGRRRLETLLAVYEPLLGSLEGVTDAKALLLQRMIRLKVDAGSQRALLSQGLEQSRQFTLALPDNPHAIYLEGYIRRKLLVSDGGTSALLVTPSTLDAARQIIAQWTRLLAVAPDYVGPDAHDAKAIAADVARLRSAVAAVEKTPTAPASAPIPRVTPLDDAASEAWESLARFDAGTDGERRIVCREWLRAERDAAGSNAALTLDLSCAVQGADAEAALTLLGKLAATDVAIDVCAWAGRVRGVTTTGNRASVEARLTEVAPGCGTP